MPRVRARLALPACLVLGVTAASLGQDPEAQKPATAVATPAVATVAADTAEAKAERFAITVELKGVLQPEKFAEISVEPKEWATLKVVEVAPQGTQVKKGDVVLRLDTDDIDEQIRTLEFAVRLAELTLEQTVKETAILEESAPLDLELAERTYRQAQEDLAYFLEVDKSLTKESNRRSLENSEFNVEYSNEELVQLRKMYAEDDLTEETEEMILKRTERQLENAKFSLEMARIRSKKLLETDLPRQELQVTDSAQRSEIAYRKAAETTPLVIDTKKIELAKQRYDLEESLAKLKTLRADRDQLVVAAPVDGVVYHGTWQNGTWSLAATLQAQLKPGGTLPAKTPVLAIVQPRPLWIETTVEEKDVALVAAGAAGTAKPTAFPDVEIPCQVTDVSNFPSEPGKFTTSLSFGQQDARAVARLVPGMTVAIELTGYENDSAIVVPSKAVFEEDGQDVVYVASGDQPERRVVKTGRSHGEKTEILEGLEPGEKIRNTKP